MSKRVYEIARELDLSTKEVIDRLNDAGIEVKSHFAVVEDPIYERVFGEGSEGAAPNGRSEAQEARTLRSRIQSPRKRLPTRRALVYILAAALAFAVAAGVGTIASLILQGNLSWLESEEPQSSDQQGNGPQRQGAVADRSQQKEADAEQEEAASQQNEAEYISSVGDIQERSVETFLDSHDKLMRYDALTAADVEEMQANQAALQELTDQGDDLDPPKKYRAHYEVFLSAINALHEAAQLAYNLAADPIAATQAEFDKYDRHVNEAATGLQRSNEILGRAPDASATDEASFEQIDPKSTEAVFVQRATPQNILLNSTYLDHPSTNGDPNAFILVERLSELGGDADNSAHEIGVWYDARRRGGRWAIFNQHHAPMTVGATFEVVVMEGPNTLIHRAAPQNTAGNSTYVDDPLTNGNPDAVLTITQNWNPGGIGNTYNDHPVGIRYDADEKKWVIFNRDRDPMPNGAAFNVAVLEDWGEFKTIEGVQRVSPLS